MQAAPLMGAQSWLQRGRITRIRGVAVGLVMAKTEVGTLLDAVAVMMLVVVAWSHDGWFFVFIMY